MAFQPFVHNDYFMNSINREAAIKEQKRLEAKRKEATQEQIAQQLSFNDKQEYGVEILTYMFEMEMKTMPDVASIDIQSEVQWFMRPFLLDWLVESHSVFGLSCETFFLTLNILDRYCSKRVVYRRHYQLVGCTALLIAAKYDEQNKQVPRVKELANMCCHLYDEDMFIQMERHVMMTLEWSVGAPTVAGFLRSAFDDIPADVELEHMAMYISKLAMYHREFVGKRPSDIATAALALSQVILNRQSRFLAGHWATKYDELTMIALSQHVRQRSKVLFQEYQRPNASRVSVVLDSFIARHDLIAQNANGQPLTPPETSLEQPSMLHTPPKQRMPVIINMPPTPPITPSADSFTGGYPGMNVCAAPDTPSYSAGATHPRHYQAPSMMTGV